MNAKKLEKKKLKLAERIKQLEDGLVLSLQKKSSSATEIDMPGTMRQIRELKEELDELNS
jgi:hypothetical protein